MCKLETWQSLAWCLLAAGAAAQSTSTAGAYGQCGGSGYAGPTACGSGYLCTTYNPYYYQCVPGATATTTPTSSSTTALASSSSSSTSTPPSSSTTATATTPTLTTITTTTTTAAATGTGTGTPTTLVSGWYWIRAVESPYYHSYLQTQQPTTTTTTASTAGASASADAVMADAATAGQFNIVDGQLVYDTAGGGLLYMQVEDPADKTQRALATWFGAAANTYGNFSFSGDTVTWTDPDVSRGNLAAFYVCPTSSDVSTAAAGAENALFVNTGAYDYETPSGCYDVDIHSYGGSTADI